MHVRLKYQTPYVCIRFQLSVVLDQWLVSSSLHSLQVLFLLPKCFHTLLSQDGSVTSFEPVPNLASLMVLLVVSCDKRCGPVVSRDPDSSCEL